VDQAAPTHQGILWHQRQRSEDPDLDRSLSLRAGGNPPQEAGPGGEPLPDSTDFERYAFREVPILQAFQTSDSETDLLQDGNQLILFDF
jgi:hypothetical protein